MQNAKEHMKVNKISIMQQKEQNRCGGFFGFCLLLHPVKFKDIVPTGNNHSVFILMCIYNIYQVFSNKCSPMVYHLTDNYCISSYSMLNYVFSSVLLHT